MGVLGSSQDTDHCMLFCPGLLMPWATHDSLKVSSVPEPTERATPERAPRSTCRHEASIFAPSWHARPPRGKSLVAFLRSNQSARCRVICRAIGLVSG